MCCRPSTSPRWRTCSFAVKTKIVQILFIFLCTVLAAAAQDMLPSFGGAKPPLLLALTLYWAFSESTGSVRDRASGKRRTFAVRWIFAAFVTGAFEDALSEFPFGCATGYYLLAGAAAYIFGCHPYHNYSLVAAVGAARPKSVFYGNNRADFSFIPGNMAPGILFRHPDHFENYDDWPFLWGQNEGTIAGNVGYLIFGSAFKNMAR